MVCGPLVVYLYAYTSREIEKRERERGHQTLGWEVKWKIMTMQDRSMGE